MEEKFMFKKILSIFVLCLLVLNMGMAYGVENVDNDKEIGTYRAYPCPNDNCSGLLFSSTSYGTWYNTGTSRTCTHFPYGLDYLFERAATKTTSCNTCSFGYSNTTYETKWVCYGGSR